MKLLVDLGEIESPIAADGVGRDLPLGRPAADSVRVFSQFARDDTRVNQIWKFFFGGDRQGGGEPLTQAGHRTITRQVESGARCFLGRHVFETEGNTSKSD